MMITVPQQKYPFCPICGKMSQSTSDICPEHYPVTFDNKGNILKFQQWEVCKWLI